MKKYEKPFIEDEDIELEDIIAASGEKDVNTPDVKDPFTNVTPNN